ncbi:MAG TPA: CcmD family protein [Lentimicrobium sp.]|jgi:CcmD family protein|nr:CcmD family protein [Lentimicrobium sp.]
MESDKFFVVAIVMAIIFTGLAVYLFLLDRKLSRIEKKQSEMMEELKRKEQE